MTARNIWATVGVALLLVLAGCSSGVGPGAGDAGDTEETGTVNFYVSDQQNVIDQFEHLNVTVTEVTFVKADGEGDSGNESESRVTVNIDNVTVDLTKLQGAKSALIGQSAVPSGNYSKVFLSVGNIDGTLTDGSSADVKLPSNRLQLNRPFTVGNGEEVNFVFDISVVERGPNGYILKPVAGQSGTSDDVEIDEVEDATVSSEGAENAGGADDADGETTETETATATEGAASLDFYLSDEENDIGDFDSLEVTITKIGVHRSGNGSGGGGEWIERKLNGTTADLTELQGANATLLDSFDVPSGEYDKVFVYVSAVNGTLTDGSSANVKLPSGKLQLTKPFTLSANSSVEFVFDITVVKAGNSGKYILKPVVGQSGTSDEVEIDKQDDEKDANESDANETDADDETETADLNATFVGNVTTGANATVSVTQNGSAVANATVVVEQEIDGNETTVELTTDANGTVSFAVDENATNVEVTVTTDDGEAELEREFEDATSASDDGSAGDSDDSNSLVGLAD